MTTQQNATQTNKILALLAEYAGAQAELEHVKRFTARRTEYIKIGPEPTPQPRAWPETGTILEDKRPERQELTWPEMDAVRIRLAALPPLPDRAEAEAACVAELQALATEFTALEASLLEDLAAELAAKQAEEAARIAAAYAREWRPRFGSVKEAEIVYRRAQKASEAAVIQRKGISNQRDAIVRIFQNEYGILPGNSAQFAEAARARVERILGSHYREQAVADGRATLEKLGIDPAALAKLVA